MPYTLPNGATLTIAAAYGPAIPVTALSNAASAMATVPAEHGLQTGTFVELSSGWSRLNSRIVRIGAVDGASVELLGQDTAREAVFPAGGGIGSLRPITAWIQIQQVLKVGTSGGEQQYKTFQPLDSDRELKLPTIRSAMGIQFDIGDDPSLPGYKVAAAASDDRLQRALKLYLPNDSVLLYNGTCSLNKTPSLESNEVMQVKLDVSLLAEPVRY